MVWQDYALSFVLIAFAYALVPQIFNNYRDKVCGINLQTSYITTNGLYIMAFVFFTLGLYFSFIINIVMGTLWLTILIQGLIYRK